MEFFLLALIALIFLFLYAPLFANRRARSAQDSSPSKQPTRPTDGSATRHALLFREFVKSSPNARLPQESNLTKNATRFADMSDDDFAIEKSFRTVFAMMSSARRDGIVQFYMRKHSCGMHEAMRFAIVDRQNDEERFR